MLTQHIAIVPEAEGLSASDLSRVSAAIQKQVTRDLSPTWSVRATVDAFPHLEDVPVGYWPVLIRVGEQPSEGAVYLDDRGQPYARVQAAVGSTNWSVAASRVCLEMLVNPYGDRTVTALSLRTDQGLVEFLLDVWGPCSGEANAYAVNDVLVADFCTPAFFGQVAAGGIDRCSFRGSVPLPLHVPQGGHLAWYDPVSHAWWLRNHWHDNPVDMQWDSSDRRSTAVREWVRAERVARASASVRPMPDWLGLRPRRPVAAVASQVRAQRLRTLLSAPSALFETSDDLSERGREADERYVAAPFEAVDDRELEPASPEGGSCPDVAAPSGRALVAREAEPAARGMASTNHVPATSPEASQPGDTATKHTRGSSPHSTLAPVAISSPVAPASAPRHGLSLLGGAVAGAALVVFLWGRQDSIARSAAGTGPTVSAQPQVAVTAAPLPAQSPAPPVSAVSAPPPNLAAKNLPSSPAAPLSPKKAGVVAAPSSVKSPRRVRANQERRQAADAGTQAALTNSTEPALDALVDTRE